MQNAELVERLYKIYACSKAIRWIKHNNLDLISAWSECPDIHWLRWFVDALELEYKPGENVDDFRSQYNFEEIKTQLVLISDKTFKNRIYEEE